MSIRPPAKAGQQVSTGQYWTASDHRWLTGRVALMILLQWTLAILSIAAFAFGGRRTWIIPYTVDVVYVELAGLFL
jgi:hypothetical protein